MARRLYRIYAHSLIHHPILFFQFETETFSFHRFTDFIIKEKLINEEELDIQDIDKKVLRKLIKKKK
jgi:hypothetical protein